jgi:hypothetical protein
LSQQECPLRRLPLCFGIAQLVLALLIAQTAFAPLRNGLGPAPTWSLRIDPAPVAAAVPLSVTLCREENLEEKPDLGLPWQSHVFGQLGGSSHRAVLASSAGRNLPLRYSVAHQPTGPPRV